MRALIFIDRDNLYYFGGNIKTLVPLALPPTSLRDMEVIKPEELTAALTKVIQAQKIQPASLLLVFSSRSVFQKELPEKSTPEERITQQTQFDEAVPFNHVLSQIFTQGKKTKVIAINKEYAYTLKNLLKSIGFPTDGIVPCYALFGDQPVTASAEVAQQLLRHYGSLVQVSYPLDKQEKVIIDQAEQEFMEGKKKNNTRLYLMIGSFVLLLAVLAYMFFFYRKSAPAAQKKSTLTPTQTAQQVQPTVSTPSETPAPPTPTPEIAKEDLSFEVLNGSGIPGQANQVEDRLVEAGFKNITTGNAPTQSSEKTSVVFRPAVARSFRDEIVVMIKSLGLAVTTQENDQITSDVLITIYQTPQTPSLSP